MKKPHLRLYSPDYVGRVHVAVCVDDYWKHFEGGVPYVQKKWDVILRLLTRKAANQRSDMALRKVAT